MGREHYSKVQNERLDGLRDSGDTCLEEDQPIAAAIYYCTADLIQTMLELEKW